tara:strand:- start:3887 stop:4501 length:615 start_codon:yes stop_codon:yes gene_type:complete
MAFDVKHWDNPIGTMYGRGTKMTHLFAGSRPAFSFVNELNEIVNPKEVTEEQNTFLDFGGGTGRVAMFLCMFYNTPVTSYDPNSKCVEIGNEIKTDLQNTILNEKLTLTDKIPDQEFNYIISAAVFEHLNSSVFVDAIRTVRDCLRVNGIAILYIRSEAGLDMLRPHVEGRIPRTPNPKRHVLVSLTKKYSGQLVFLKNTENYY